MRRHSAFLFTASFFLTGNFGAAARLQNILPLPPGTVVTALKFDSAGNICLGGYVKPAQPKSSSDLSDAFVAKLSSDGSQTLFRTVLAGNTSDQVTDIAVGADGSILASGFSSSTDFPTTSNSLQPALANGTSQAFYAKIDPKGAIVYATFLGGDSNGSALAIAADSAGAVYLTGRRFGPETGAFVTKLDANGKNIFTTSVIGGNRVALDAQGNIYVAGTLIPPNQVPTTSGAYQTRIAFSTCANASRNLPCLHQYVAKLDPSGTRLLYSTFVAGSVEEGPTTLAVDAQGNAYLAGSTTSSDYPVTPGAFQPASLAGPLPAPVAAVPPSIPAPSTGFVTKLNSTGTALIFSTFLGGSMSDSITSLSLDSGGNVYVAGNSGSEDFPGLSGVPGRCTTGPFVTRLSADGSSLSETQLLYGVVPDSPLTAVALDQSGKPWVAKGGILARTDLFAAPTHFACAIDAADFARLGQVAPGQLIALFGTNLSFNGVSTANPLVNGRFPTSLAGVSVTFNGVPAPLLYVSPSQVNLQVPYEVSGQTAVHMQIDLPATSGTLTESRDFTVAERAPSVFVAESGMLVCGPTTVFGQHPLSLNEDGTPNSCQNPAAPGSTVTIFLSGLGATTSTESGAVSPPTPIPLNLGLSNANGVFRFVSSESVPGAISGIWALKLQVRDGFGITFSIGGLPLRESNLIVWNRR